MYQCHLARYNYALGYARAKKVLDASCGSGYGVDLMYDVSKEVLGVDVSVEAVEYAKKRYRGKFEVVDLDKDFPDGKFDLVVSFETIEHLDNPDFFLENVKKNSKKFLFSIPISTLHPYHNSYHKRNYSVDDAKKLIYKHFDNVVWRNQRKFNISRSGRDVRYLIGRVNI